MRRAPLFGTFLQNRLPIVYAVLAHLDQPGKDALNAWLDENLANMTSQAPASA